MKLTIPDTYKKQIIPFIIFVSLALFIWFVGPLLSIAHQIPFESPEKRLYVITALFLLWVLKIIFLDIAPPAKNKSADIELSPELAKKLQTLQGRFQGALNFLKKVLVNKQGKKFNLSHLPWYLLIGPSGSGKTTLLANSKANFILSKQFKQAEAVVIPSSDACDWWVTRDLVLIDVPGYYFISREKATAKNIQKNKVETILWNTLLGLIKKPPVKDKLNGVIIALNLPEIMKKTSASEKNILIHDLKKRITDLRNQLGAELSFHFVITKCDLLPGFLEFFSETGSDELSQAWGFHIPSLKTNDKLLDVFSSRFNALIKRINKQLLGRLHQERNPATRPYIKDFPLHLERLKEAITTMLKTLAMPDLRLQSIYLTSATQTPAEEPVNYTQASPHNLTHQALQIMRAPIMPSRSYFVKQLIAQNFLYSSHTISEKEIEYNWQRRAMYAASIGIIVTAILILSHDFKRSAQKTYALQNDLMRYQMYIQQNDPSDARLVKALPLLDSLQQATNDSNQQLTRLERFLSFYSNKSQETANAIYFKALQTIIIPEIKNDLEKSLAKASNKNPVSLYTALKAYLMLADPENFQASFIANTLSKMDATPMNRSALNQLTSHINAIFATHRVSVELDQNLILEVRKQLINLPSNELGFVILKNMNANNADSTIDLGTNLGNPPVFVSKQIANRIPNMFVASHFENVISDEINTAATEALKGNWVLGEITPSVNQPTTDALMTQLRDQYIAKYIDIWESQIANIQPYAPKNLLQADEVIQNLTNNNSPLLQLLQTIKTNTAFDPIITASPKMMALDNLINGPDIKQSPLYEAFVDLRQLHFYLQKILNSSNSDKSAFIVASNRLQNSDNDPITTIHKLAEQNPEPLKSWLNTIANQSWDFILKKAGEHVATAWQANILPTYNENIANRYPFVQNSDKDVSLQQFTNFLGHRGMLANFYMTYLKPFVNDTGEQWTWRTVDNQHIPFSNGLLANLQRAAQLQRAFFPNGDNKLAIEFTMQPIALDPSMRTLTLNINGQQAAFQKNGKRLPRTFTWPGNYYSHATTVSFITPKSQMISNTLKGDWGLFRLISHSTEGINDKKALLLNIAANGHSAKYMLFTDARLNPFLPTSMAHFELPQDIMQS